MCPFSRDQLCPEMSHFSPLPLDDRYWSVKHSQKKPVPGSAFGSLASETDRLRQVLDGRVLDCSQSSSEEAPKLICAGFLNKSIFAL